MADGYNYITTTGVIVPDTSTLQSDVEAEYRNALGQDLIVDPSTPQGAMIVAETVARGSVLANNAALANQINPNLAGGPFLDAIWALTGGQRIAASNTLVSGVALTGLPGVIVPAGSQASLSDGTLFETTSGVVLDSAGHATVNFQAVDVGPIVVAIGALNQIVTGILGWDSVTNPTAGVPGKYEESDIASRQRRKNTLSLQNVALPEAITSALYDTPNVKSIAFRENYTSAPLTIDGVTLVANSIFVCVDGGTDADVASALLANKSLGCNWNGTTTVNVTDSISGQVYPVSFSRPTEIPIGVRVTVKNAGSLTDIQPSVRSAVLAYANGEIDGEAGLVIGASVSPFELGGAVAKQLPGLYVQKVELTLISVVNWQTVEIPITIQQKATVIEGNITVVVLS